MSYQFFRQLCLVLFLSLTTAKTLAQTQEPTLEQTVHSYINAFNGHDTEAMLKLVTNDVEWLSIDGETIIKETNSKAALRSAMIDYFKSCTSCQARLVHIFSSSNRVSALEVASFETNSGLQKQQSMSLYEFSGTLIRRVYYFPAEK